MMGLFYKTTPRQNLELRNRIFLDRGIPALTKNGFERSPFTTSWFGRNELNDFRYELFRLNSEKELEAITVDIIRGENWIQIRLNIFEPQPELKSLKEIQGEDGLKYHLPPNSIKLMRLRSDDYKGLPLCYMLLYPKHKIGPYFSERGFLKRAEGLANLIEKDMLNIDSFVKRWKEMYLPNRVSWNGEISEER